MNRADRRRNFKGYERLQALGSYGDLDEGFHRDLMVAICKAVTPGRGNLIMSDETIVEEVFNAIRQEALDVYFRWSDSGAEVKTELRVPGSMPIVPVSTFILFEDGNTVH